MRRLVIFLLLFGGGLGALLYLSARHKREQAERARSAEEIEQGLQTLPFTRLPDEAPAADGPQREGGTVGGTLDGWANFDVFEEGTRGHKLYSIQFEKVSHLGEDVYDLIGITAQTYDSESEELETTLVAARGRARIEWRGGRPAVGQTERVALFDAVVTMHRGTPLAPLVLTLPEVYGDLERDLYTSDAPVLVEGVGVLARGTGLVADQHAGTLRLVRDGHLELDVDAERRVELDATGNGPMQLTRTAMTAAGEELELTVEGGGRALLRGAEALHVDGRTLRLAGEARRATVDGETRRRFFPAEATAEGDVVARHALGESRGGRLDVRFDEAGEVQRLDVAEAPRLGVEVELATERDGARRPVWIDVDGVGPLALEGDAGLGRGHFDLPGPATIAARETELVLHASERIDGALREEGASEVKLHGEVTGRLYGVDVRGRDVDLVGEKLAEDRRLLASTLLPARLAGADDEGRPFVLDAREQLRASFGEGDVRIPYGRDVRLELTRDDGTWLTEAGEVFELDPRAGDFRAEGGVRARGPLGTGSAARAIGRGRRELELFGAPATADRAAEPVRLDALPGVVEQVQGGSLRAQHVVLRERFARADGDVKLRLVSDGVEHELDCAWLELATEGEPNSAERVPFTLEARDVTRGLARDARGSTQATARLVTGHGVSWRDETGALHVELLELVGSGGVTATFTGERVLTGIGETFRWTPDGGARLAARPGERVESRGSFRPGGPRYVLTATWIEEGGGELEALDPRIESEDGALLGDGRLRLSSAQAEWMALDELGLLLSGAAHFEGAAEDGTRLVLDAADLHLEQRPGERASSESFERLVAWNGFEVHLGDELFGSGEILEASYDTLRMEGRPARVEMRGYALESYDLVYDVPRVLVTTAQGRLIGAPGTVWEGWTATYESLRPFEDADSTVMAMRQLVLENGEEEVHADWGLLWLDRDEWVRRTADWLGRARGEQQSAVPTPHAQEPERAPRTKALTVFGRIDASRLSEVLEELYLEGGVEYLVKGDRIARLGAAYFDLVGGHGWFRDCELWLRTGVRGIPTRIAVRADWLRHSADGTLSADDAQITDCEWAEPDYFVRTKNLRMRPTDEEGSVWDVLLEDNSLEFKNGLAMPLPRVHYKSDGKGLPTLGSLRFGSTARFGTFIEATMSIDVGESVTNAVAKMTHLDPAVVDGDWRLRASYYKLRGLQLGSGFRLTAGDKFWANLYVDGVFDTGRDKGIVRSKTDSAEDFRWVIHSRSRFLRSPREWFDLQFATQSDAGVQSEFYEGEFIRYDKRDNFLRWRMADNATYWSALARVRVDEFRNDVERLPDFGVLHGRTPFSEVAGVPLLYTASFDAAWLRRREGASAVFSPFDPTFDDGLGARDVLRADTRHRVEAPFELGVGGVRVSPYGAFVATAWDEGVDPDTAPSRGALMFGAKAEATYFRTWRYGVVHDLTPTVGVRTDVGTFDADGTPIHNDALDDPLEGKFVDLGLRSRWRIPGSLRRLDVAATLSHGTDVAPGLEEGWQPLAVLAEFFAAVGKVPFGLRHDARYDLDGGETVLSYTGASVLPWKDVGFEWAYHHALDAQRQLYYDAMSFGARWEASPKWQIEGRQTISRIDNENLDSKLLLRRIGHDFVFEIEYGLRAGEGSSSVSFNIRPELGWRQPGFGLIDTLKRLRL